MEFFYTNHQRSPSAATRLCKFSMYLQGARRRVRAKGVAARTGAGTAGRAEELGWNVLSPRKTTPLSRTACRITRESLFFFLKKKPPFNDGRPQQAPSDTAQFGAPTVGPQQPCNN